MAGGSSGAGGDAVSDGVRVERAQRDERGELLFVAGGAARRLAHAGLGVRGAPGDLVVFERGGRQDRSRDSCSRSRTGSAAPRARAASFLFAGAACAASSASTSGAVAAAAAAYCSASLRVGSSPLPRTTRATVRPVRTSSKREDRQPEQALRHVVRLRHRRPEQQADGPRGPLEQRAQRVLVREGDGVDLDVDAVAVEPGILPREQSPRGRRSNDPRRGGAGPIIGAAGAGRATGTGLLRAGPAAAAAGGLRMRVAGESQDCSSKEDTLKRLGLVARARHPQANVAAAVVAGEK